MINKKISGLLSFLLLLFSLLMIRITYLATKPALMQTAKAQSDYSLVVNQTRAAIYDQNFQSFVNQKESYKAVVIPDPSCIDALISLNPTLDREELAKKIQANKPFVVDVNTPNSNHENIKILKTTRRYMDNNPAAHIIGYTNSDGEGVVGIEKAYNDFLKENGETLKANCTVNAKGNYVSGQGVTISSSGSNSAGVVLTLDSGIQDIIERVGSKMIPKGAIVVLDAENANILGSASFPSFSQNNPAASINDTINTPMINRILQAFHVGSTFKIATAAAALENKIPPSRTYNCVGKIEVSGQTFRCHNHHGHGILNLQEALRESCNPYFITLGLEVGAESIRNIASDIGFGRSYTLADSIVSARGVLPSLDNLKNPGDVANFSFGQGELTGTPLQVSELIFSVCNHGNSVAPTLIKGITYDGKTIENETQPPAAMHCMSENTANIIKEDLYLAIEQQTNLSLKPSKTTAGGKSATAQTGQKDENGNDIYQVWYAGFFPNEAPKYIVTVLLEGGTSGSDNAEPVFSQIADLITEYSHSKN